LDRIDRRERIAVPPKTAILAMRKGMTTTSFLASGNRKSYPFLAATSADL